MSTNHNFWRERRAEADSNQSPSAYQHNALPLGQTGSQYRRGPCLLCLSHVFGALLKTRFAIWIVWQVIWLVLTIILFWNSILPSCTVYVTEFSVTGNTYIHIITAVCIPYACRFLSLWLWCMNKLCLNRVFKETSHFTFELKIFNSSSAWK